MKAKKYIVIVDMDQPGNRRPVVLTDEEENPGMFQSLEAIVRLKAIHPLGVFTWWAFNWQTGESEDLL
jgi:hypothetical protein